MNRRNLFKLFSTAICASAMECMELEAPKTIVGFDPSFHPSEDSMVWNYAINPNIPRWEWTSLGWIQVKSIRVSQSTENVLRQPTQSL